MREQKRCIHSTASQLFLIRRQRWYYASLEKYSSLTGTSPWFSSTDVPQCHMYIQHAKEGQVLQKKKKVLLHFFHQPFFFLFFFFSKSCCSGKKCVDEWSSHTKWVADSSGDLGDQFICSASAICWDQSLRCPRCLSPLKESQGLRRQQKLCSTLNELVLRSVEPSLLQQHRTSPYKSDIPGLNSHL